MIRRLKSVLAVMLVLAMVLTLCPQNVAAKKKGKSITVSTQEELDAALASGKYRKIVVKTEEVLPIKIAEGEYKKVKLVIEAPNVSVTNLGAFDKVAVNDAEKYTEKAAGNSITVKAQNLELKVAKNAEVAGITLSKDATNINFTNAGKVEDLKVKGETNVSLVQNGSMGTVTVTGSADLAISGKTEEAVSINVKESALGASITAQTPIDCKTETGVNVTLQNGAEGSSVALENGEAGVNVVNETEKKVVVTDSEGKKNNVKAGTEKTTGEVAALEEKTAEKEAAKAEAEAAERKAAEEAAKKEAEEKAKQQAQTPSNSGGSSSYARTEEKRVTEDGVEYKLKTTFDANNHVIAEEYYYTDDLGLLSHSRKYVYDGNVYVGKRTALYYYYTNGLVATMAESLFDENGELISSNYETNDPDGIKMRSESVLFNEDTQSETSTVINGSYPNGQEKEQIIEIKVDNKTKIKQRIAFSESGDVIYYETELFDDGKYKHLALSKENEYGNSSSICEYYGLTEEGLKDNNALISSVTVFLNGGTVYEVITVDEEGGRSELYVTYESPDGVTTTQEDYYEASINKKWTRFKEYHFEELTDDYRIWYDENGKKEYCISYNKDGKKECCIWYNDNERKDYKYDYDKDGKVVREEYFRDDDSGTLSGTRVYSGDGRVVDTLYYYYDNDALSATSISTRDAGGNLVSVSHIIFDPEGKVLELETIDFSDPAGTAENTFNTEHYQDSSVIKKVSATKKINGQLVNEAVISYDESGVLCNFLTKEYDYDNNYYLVTEVGVAGDGTEHKIASLYDLSSELIQSDTYYYTEGVLDKIVSVKPINGVSFLQETVYTIYSNSETGEVLYFTTTGKLYRMSGEALVLVSTGLETYKNGKLYSSTTSLHGPAGEEDVTYCLTTLFDDEQNPTEASGWEIDGSEKVYIYIQYGDDGLYKTMTKTVGVNMLHAATGTVFDFVFDEDSVGNKYTLISKRARNFATKIDYDVDTFYTFEEDYLDSNKWWQFSHLHTVFKDGKPYYQTRIEYNDPNDYKYYRYYNDDGTLTEDWTPWDDTAPVQWAE